ncbi:LytR/AlgR family response regulator transcription factor [Tellurirhabdus rosea]|uniref:LytR/AlgR family response regulator transcription factor n=1 Tax=Tellurirhabdus rosea TaxID=2674997 RepID=UPI002256D413|nr:LytTR family DNA-binding domain-containing protein [Tellurirhabdus rosea]
MFQLLNQPYPLEENPWVRLRRTALIGLFVGLFLLIFQPFGLQLWRTDYKAAKILGFGVITAVMTAGSYFVPAWIWPAQFREERWTVGREIFWVTTNIMLIALANQLYLNWLIGKYTHPFGWLGTILVTYLIGVFPTGASVIANYIIRLKRYAGEAATVPVHAVHPVAEQQTRPLTLTAENGKDTLSLPPACLLYIESSDNYSTVVYLKEDKLAKTLLRSSLSRLEGQINEPDIVRCHRSYLVNLELVEKVTGNAQGYKLHLLDGQAQVPVARRYNESLIARLKELS